MLNFIFLSILNYFTSRLKACYKLCVQAFCLCVFHFCSHKEVYISGFSSFVISQHFLCFAKYPKGQVVRRCYVIRRCPLSHQFLPSHFQFLAQCHVSFSFVLYLLYSVSSYARNDILICKIISQKYVFSIISKIYIHSSIIILYYLLPTINRHGPVYQDPKRFLLLHIVAYQSIYVKYSCTLFVNFFIAIGQRGSGSCNLSPFKKLKNSLVSIQCFICGFNGRVLS